MDFSRITSKITLRRTLFVLLLVILFWLFYWVANHGYIEVTASNIGSGDISYQLLNQGSLQNNNYTSKSSTTKKLVSKNSYEVLVRQADKSSFTVIHSKGFFRTTRVSAPLQQENARRFVGDKPSSCTAYAGGRLYSYVCGDSLNNLVVHVAATDASPTYAQKKVSDSDSGFIESVFETKEGVLALTKLIGASDGEDTASHSINILNPDLSVAQSVGLLALSPNRSYVAKPYKDGFLVYAEDFSQVLYYSSTSAQPVSINVEKPKTKDLAPASITTQNGQVVVLYTHSTEANDKKPTSEVFVIDGSSTKHYTLPKNYTVARTCGQQSLCLVGVPGLDVYDIGKTKARYTYSVSGVLFIDNLGQRLLAARTKDTLNLDISTQAGYISYSYGDYNYGGFAQAGNTYVLSLSKPSQQDVALLIDPQKNNTDGVDKKLLELEKAVGVKSISINSNHVFIVGNYGEMVFDPATGGFDYNPAVKKAAIDRINQAIDKIGIDRKAYTVVIN